MPAPTTVWLGTDTYVRLTFKDVKTGDPITNATVTVTIFDDASGVQNGAAINLAHLANGLYEGMIAYNRPGLLVGQRLRIRYFADGGTNRRATDDLKAVVRVRNAMS